MRNLIATLVLLLSATLIWGQNPVKWSFSQKDLGNDEFELIFTAEIPDGWVIYSTKVDPDIGPVPTEVVLETVPTGVEKVGGVEESSTNLIKKFDKVFEAELMKFTKKAIYKQKVRVKDGYNGSAVKGYVTFMTCNDEKCFPPKDEEFSIALPAKKASKTSTTPAPKTETIIETPVLPTAPTTDAGNPTLTKTPVRWDISGKRLSEQEYEINFKATVNEGFAIYSQFSKTDKGPMPTTFNIEGEGDRFKVLKSTETSEFKSRKYDKFFKMTLTKFEKEVVFTKKIKLESGGRTLKGRLFYMACNDELCYPPQEYDFRVTLPSKMLEEATVLAHKPAPSAEDTTAAAATPETFDAYTFNFTDYSKGNCTEAPQEDRAQMSLWWIFLAGFGGGLIALLTPCVFPMIPLTVTFFTKQSKTKAKGITNALIYGFSIIGIYVALGLLVTGFFGPDALNLLSTNAFFNLLFFTLFVVFAFSFFGFFEITLPSSWANQSDRMADSGGLVGIFFMAFTLSLVSFSCTGPIIGTLLVETARGGGPTLIGEYVPLRPLVGMFGFSLALALPFALFAAFPGWLNSLPKSGGWMTTVKVTLGFLELALSLKFLSVADMTYHWGILPIEIFLGIWIVLFAGLGAYLWGFIKFPHDEPKQKISKARYALGLMSFLFVAYLAKGFNYEPLQLLSGLAPPAHYNLFQDKSEEAYPDCPHGIRCFKDYNEGLAFAKENDLPIMIDFTGFGCVNCRKVEENVWVEDRVKRILSTDYVLVSLYVDDRKKVEQTYVSPYSGTKIRTVGNKWADFQAHFFKEQTQPLYVLVDNDGTVLNKPIGYNEAKDPNDYIEFLQCGLDRKEANRAGLSKK